MLVGFLGRLELLGNFLPHPSASTLTSSIVVSSQISTSFPCSVEFYLLVYNPSRSYLTPECEFHLNQARSLSYLYVSPNKTCRSTNSRFPTFNLTLCARTSREVQPVVHVRNVLRFLVRDTKNGDLLYILRIVMLLLFSATLGGGGHWRDTRAAAPAAASSSRPASTASLSTGTGTPCGPLVCLCYTRVAMHGRSFPSARVIAVVLPLPYVLNVLPSVEPTTIVNVCIQFAGFEQN